VARRRALGRDDPAPPVDLHEARDGLTAARRAQARRRALGNIQFIGQLFKQKMLTEKIMHQCIRTLLGEARARGPVRRPACAGGARGSRTTAPCCRLPPMTSLSRGEGGCADEGACAQPVPSAGLRAQVDAPKREDVECLCKLMATVGSLLDNGSAKGHEHMNVYFNRIGRLAAYDKLESRLRFLLRARGRRPRAPMPPPAAALGTARCGRRAARLLSGGRARRAGHGGPARQPLEGAPQGGGPEDDRGDPQGGARRADAPAHQRAAARPRPAAAAGRALQHAAVRTGPGPGGMRAHAWQRAASTERAGRLTCAAEGGCCLPSSCVAVPRAALQLAGAGRSSAR